MAVSRTANAIGWMNRLMVSIRISIGIRARGVPWGRKCARDALVLNRKPKITAPAHRGIAIPRFVDSCVVGVKEWGRRPNKFVDPINKINDRSISVHDWPFVLWISIICLEIDLTNHCWRVLIRLLINREGDGKNKVGNIIIRINTGMPKNIGVMNEVNKFSFILFLKGYCNLEL